MSLDLNLHFKHSIRQFNQFNCLLKNSIRQLAGQNIEFGNLNDHFINANIQLAISELRRELGRVSNSN